MKHLTFPLLLLSIFLLSNCIADTSTPTITTDGRDTLAYTLERLIRAEQGCEGENCTQIQINYIQFESGEDSLAIEELNQNIMNSFRGRDYTNIIAYVNGFMREYNQDKADFPDMPKWNEESNQKVIFSHPKMIGLQTDMYSFRGGAHPIYGTIFHNYDPRTGKELNWKDLLKPDQEEKMLRLGETHFRETYRVPARETLQESEFQFENGIFYLPDNFVFDRDGITFLYGLYEIGPYTAGEHEFTVPYNKVKSLLKADYADLL